MQLDSYIIVLLLRILLLRLNRMTNILMRKIGSFFFQLLTCHNRSFGQAFEDDELTENLEIQRSTRGNFRTHRFLRSLSHRCIT